MAIERIAADRLADFVARVFSAVGVPDGDARKVAEAMVEADAATPAILEAIEAGRLYVAPNGSIAPVKGRVERMLTDLQAR